MRPIDAEVNQMREIWLPVVEFEGTYEVSNTGKIRRLATKGKPGSGNYARSAHEIKPHKNNKGYLVVDLWQENKRKQKLLHRVVAEAFIPNPKNLLEVNHKDEHPQNCCSANLEWCTRLYNMNYGTCGAKIAKAKGKCVKQCDLRSNRVVRCLRRGDFGEGVNHESTGRMRRKSGCHERVPEARA